MTGRLEKVAESQSKLAAYKGRLQIVREYARNGTMVEIRNSETVRWGNSEVERKPKPIEEGTEGEIWPASTLSAIWVTLMVESESRKADACK